MSGATSKSRENLMKAALQQDSSDRFFQSAYNKLTRSITRPGGRRGRWIFDDASHGTYKPWRALTEPMQMAMDAGASEEDVMAIVHTLAGLVHAHYAGKDCEVATVKEALRLSLNTEAEEIAAQADVLANPTDANIEKAIEKTGADDRADRTLLTLLRGALASNALRPRVAR